MRRMLRAEAGPFATLFLLELRRNWARLVVTAAVYLMLMATYSFPALGDREVVRGAYMLAASWAVILISLAAILFAFLAVRHEWRGQTHYLLLSLPVRGWVVLGAKMLAVCVQLALLLLLANGVLWAAREWAHWRGTGGFLLERAVPARLTWIDAVSHATGVATLFEQLPLSAAGFLAYVLSRPFRRLFWLLAGLAYLGIVYVAMTRGGLYPLSLFNLVVCELGRRLPLCTNPFYYQSLIASMILMSAGVLWLAGVLWDRKVEV